MPHRALTLTSLSSTYSFQVSLRFSFGILSDTDVCQCRFHSRELFFALPWFLPVPQLFQKLKEVTAIKQQNKKNKGIKLFRAHCFSERGRADRQHQPHRTLLCLWRPSPTFACAAAGWKYHRAPRSVGQTLSSGRGEALAFYLTVGGAARAERGEAGCVCERKREENRRRITGEGTHYWNYMAAELEVNKH